MFFLFDPVVQHIVLPQIGLPQNKYFKHAIQGDHCVWETPYRETTVFGSNDPNHVVDVASEHILISFQCKK